MKKQSNNKLFKLALASTMAAGAVVAVAPQADAAGTSFTDLTPEKSHYDTVMNLFERGLISGYEDKTFKPNEAIKRGHAALIISNILGLDTENVTDPGFTDVPKTHPYYGAIAALANKGIINGFPDHTYGVNQTLTRGQMAVIISNAFELEGDVNALPFTDIAKSPYKAQIAALYTNKVTVGKTATTFDAISPVTRGQLATFVVKAEEASKVVAATEVVVEIKDGLVVTDKGTYAIDEETAKVFNEANAAALKDAKVKLVVEENSVAAVNFVAAAEPTIVGIEALTLVAADATFDAGGYNIPNVTVNGNNVEVKNVVAETISIADGLTVDLKGVEAGEITVTGNSKITLDSASKITKLVLPEGKKVQDVVSNYSQVSNVLKNIEIVDEAGTKVDAPASTGGGGGGGSKSPASYDGTVDRLISSLVDKYEEDVPSYAEVTFTPSTNTISVSVIDGTVALADVKQDLIDYNAKAPSLSEIINDENIVDFATVYAKLTHITIDGDKQPKSHYIGSNLVPNKTVIIDTVQNFVDEYQAETKATVLSDVIGASTTITVDFDGYPSLNYTLKIVGN